MPMNTIRFSVPSSTLMPGRLRETRHVLRRRVVDEVDLAREERRDARRVGDDRRVDHFVGIALEPLRP